MTDEKRVLKKGFAPMLITHVDQFEMIESGTRLALGRHDETDHWLVKPQAELEKKRKRAPKSTVEVESVLPKYLLVTGTGKDEEAIEIDQAFVDSHVPVYAYLRRR